MQRRVGVAAIAMVAAILAIVVPVGMASGRSGETDSFNGLKDGGYLRLHFYDTSAPATFTQGLTPDGPAMTGQSQNVSTGPNCSVNVAGSPSPSLGVVTATGTNASVGAETSGTKFVGLGVKSRQSNGQNCGRVEPTNNETLSVALGTGLKLVDESPAGSGLSVVAAELDIDGKGQALVRANLFLTDANGVDQPVGFALLSTATATGDSGPDATSGNNYAFPMNAAMPPCGGTAVNPTPPLAGEVCGSFAAFTKIKLSTSTQPSGTPSFALEGGRLSDPRAASNPAFAWDTQDLRANTADSVFKLQQSDGTLFCGDKVTEGTGSFTRGGNKDGSDCIVVGYEYSNRIATDNEIELLWDTVSQPSATFSLTQTWAPEDSTLFNGSPIPSKFTQVKWTDDIPGFIPAPACTSPSLPTVYGTLAAPGIDASTTTISIALAGDPHPFGDPFLLQIGHEVVSIPATPAPIEGPDGVWTYTSVTRGAADTDPDLHDAGAKVMTTPFPIITLNSTEIVAKMCISESSWVSIGLTGGNGLPQVQVTDTILAEGDMGGKR